MTLLENVRVARLDLALRFGIDGGIAERRTVIGRALEHRQMADVLGDLCDELDPGGPGADDTHPLAGQVQALRRPATGVTPGTLEAVEALEVGYVVRRQTANCRDHELGPRPVAIRQVDLPAIRALVKDDRGHMGVEPDVAAQIEL